MAALFLGYLRPGTLTVYDARKALQRKGFPGIGVFWNSSILIVNREKIKVSS